MSTENQPDNAFPSGDRHRPAAPPPQVILQQQPPSMFGRFGKFMLVVLALCVMIIFSLIASYRSYFSTADGPQEKYHSLSKTALDKIAIIRVEGAILDSDGFVKEQIDRVREDEQVKGVVLRVDSPGGTVTASDYLHYHLRKLAEERDLPIVVSMGGVCASGGYYVAMAVGSRPDTIFAERSTFTGSIGVIIPYYDLSGLLAEWNIEDRSITSGELKNMLSPTVPPSEREREVVQGLVDEAFATFKQVVLVGRPELRENPDRLEAVTTGQIFSAQQAIDNGLVDKIGFLDDAIARTAELAGVDVENVRCVHYQRPPTALGTLLGSDAKTRGKSSLDLASIVDLTTPRAYYLWTWLPSIISSR